jgi:hypothetical protein
MTAQVKAPKTLPRKMPRTTDKVVLFRNKPVQFVLKIGAPVAVEVVIPCSERRLGAFLPRRRRRRSTYKDQLLASGSGRRFSKRLPPANAQAFRMISPVVTASKIGGCGASPPCSACSGSAAFGRAICCRRAWGPKERITPSPRPAPPIAALGRV